MAEVLRINLTDRTWKAENVDPELEERFIGGRGLGAWYLTEMTERGLDPLSPGNPLIFLAGPLTGTSAPTSGRISLTTKSPLTGTITDANAGGRFGARLRFLGWDGLIVTGRSDVPVYLSVTKGGVEIRDAADLWGLDTDSVSGRLSEEGFRSHAAIGPAGENLVKFASIIVDGGRAFGRGGVGAVMGSKNLKAVALGGAGSNPDVGDEGLFDFFVYEAKKHIAANPITSQALPMFGTAMLVNIMNGIGAFPGRNFTSSTFDGARNLSGEAIASSILERKTACYSCPIACGRKTATSSQNGEGPEYETVWALGANLGIEDLEAVAEANYACNRLGIDTISMGVVIGTAMELASAGQADFPLRFGSTDNLLEAVEKTAARTDYGLELAEGSRHLALKHGNPKASLQVKGQELPAYDARVLRGQALALATSNRGGCHLRGNMLGYEVLGVPKMVDKESTGGKAGLVIVLQHLFAVLDSLIMCKFSGFALNEEHYARLLSAVTGRKVESQELLEIGERIWNLEKLYNLREGFTRADDALPERAKPEGFDEMLDEYYRFRGWDKNGTPGSRKLLQLGLQGLETRDPRLETGP
ncbi:MAG: aldehyde ferredoxin oxidoreductase family protein [Candidatus Aquicultorales bacterium]